QRLFAFFGEHALGGELRFQHLEALLQRAGAGKLHVIDDQLVRAALLVNREPAAHDDLLAVSRLKRDAALAALETAAADLPGVIFQSEVPMPGAMMQKTADFAEYINLRETFFEQARGAAIELADGKRRRRRRFGRRAQQVIEARLHPYFFTTSARGKSESTI